MSILVGLVLLVSIPPCTTTCPGINGDFVPWWIIYQQKHIPFIHNYVDSNSNEDIKMVAPEDENSVLSRFISGLIEDGFSQYLVYFSDLVNAGHITRQLQFPVNSKFVYGILFTNTSWSTGTWILSNNMLFPPMEDGQFVKPGTKHWKSATMGDSQTDLFYACLTASNTDSVKSMVESILAGNPFIYKKNIDSDAIIQPFIKELDMSPPYNVDPSFELEGSASAFLDCLNAVGSETLENCLFKYSVSEGAEINVFTRPRGMLKNSRTFCHNSNSGLQYDFGSLEKTSSSNKDWSNSMFVLSDQQDSVSSGVTCFGQDIASNTETVAIMICIRLPHLYRDLLKMSKITRWTCPQQPQISASLAPMKTGDPVSLTSSISQKVGGIPDGSLENSPKENSATFLDFQDKMFSKFCDIYDCSNSDNTGIEIDDFEQKDDLEKLPQLETWFDEKMSEVKMQENVQSKTKVKKNTKTIERQDVIKVQNSKSMDRYVTKNKKAVFGLFCQEGCNFCQKAKNELTLFRQALSSIKVDVVLVNVRDSFLPNSLRVPWTPFIRYKSQGLEAAWNDYTEESYTYPSMMKFYHQVVTSDKNPANNRKESQTEETQRSKGSSSSNSSSNNEETGRRNLLSRGLNLLSRAQQLISRVTEYSWSALTGPKGTCKMTACSKKAKDYACKIKNLHKSNKIGLATTHPSGVKDSAYAFNNIVDTCDGLEASRSKYKCVNGSAHGGSVCLYSELLAYIHDLANSFSGKIHINEIAGACHSYKSYHYKGEAVDIHCDEKHNKSTPCDHSKGINPQIIQKCTDYGGKPLKERTHIHCTISKEKR